MSIGDWIAAVGLGFTFTGGLATVIRFFIKNATAPTAAKVAEHDVQIGQALALGASANMKAARIEGYLAGQGRSRLPDVPPTLDVPTDGATTEVPLVTVLPQVPYAQQVPSSDGHGHHPSPSQEREAENQQGALHHPFTSSGAGATQNQPEWWR